MKPTFVTILPLCEVAALLKDPGMITLYLSRRGYDCTYASLLPRKVVEERAELKQVREAITIVGLQEQMTENNRIDMKNGSIFRYIFRHAKHIDVLNLYYLKHSILYGIIYKCRNPKGVLYVKLDFNHLNFKQQEKQWIEPIRRWVFSKYLRLIPDIVSAETKASLEYVRNRFKPQEDKLLLIPNGVDDQLIEDNKIAISSFAKRKNRFVVVGRIGSPEKQHELILEAITNIADWKNWEIEFIGPIELGFQSTIENFYQQHPHLKPRVRFVGPIYDRKLLLLKYNESKVFIMSSKYESFGLAYVEAQYFGNYILSTPVSSIDDFVENDNDLGLVVNTPEEMGRAMQDIIDGKNQIEDAFEKRVKPGERFRWSTICKHLDEEIQSVMNAKK